MSEAVKVWYDKKRGHLVSNAGFVLGKQRGIHPAVASQLLIDYYKAQPEHEIWKHVEEMWVS